MSPTFTLRAALFGTALALPVLLMPPGAFAQTPAPATAPPAAAAPAKPGPREHELTPKQMTERVEQHITALHTQLKITPAQQPQWDAFAQVMRDNANNMRMRFEQRGTKLATMNAADNMQSYAMVAEQHAQDMQKLASAFQSLYGSMSVEQKATADTVFRPRGERGKPAAK